MAHLTKYLCRTYRPFPQAASLLKAYPASASAFARWGKDLQRRMIAVLGSPKTVPPLMIVSTTEARNPTCAGCYAARITENRDELSDGRIADPGRPVWALAS